MAARGNGFNGALTQRVIALEGDVRDIKADILAFSGETRTSIANVVNLITERQKTPWIVIFSAAAVMVTVSGFIGSLALQPINSDLTFLKSNVVSRSEHETRERYQIETNRGTALLMESRLTELQRQLSAVEKATGELQKDKVYTADFYAQHTDLKSIVTEIRDRVERLENLRLKSASP
jgi:hypothetical protein